MLIVYCLFSLYCNIVIAILEGFLKLFINIFRVPRKMPMTQATVINKYILNEQIKYLNN